MTKKKVILLIGGHDPTGGAGITADIETALNYNFHAISILSCTTIQNTSKFTKINKMPDNYLINCFKEIIKEFSIDVVKIGLLPNINISKEVFSILQHKKLNKVPIIVDPIIKSGNNKILSPKNNLEFIIKKILPVSEIITPNIKEYKFLKKGNEEFFQKNIKNILITDYKKNTKKIYLHLLNDNKNIKNYSTNKVRKVFHGTGCTFSTSIACNIGLNNSIDDSIKISLSYMKKVILNSSLNGKKQSFLNRKCN